MIKIHLILIYILKYKQSQEKVTTRDNALEYLLDYKKGQSCLCAFPFVRNIILEDAPRIDIAEDHNVIEISRGGGRSNITRDF